MAAGDGTAAATAPVRSRPSSEADAPRRRAPAGQRQGACARLAADKLANGLLARGKRGSADIALCQGPGAGGASRLLAGRAAGRGMAADRMARGRCRTRQILAGHPPAGHAVRSPGRSGQAALADRARLPGAETGTGSWTLRGTRLARLPSPRHAV